MGAISPARWQSEIPAITSKRAADPRHIPTDPKNTAGERIPQKRLDPVTNRLAAAFASLDEAASTSIQRWYPLRFQYFRKQPGRGQRRLPLDVQRAGHAANIASTSDGTPAAADQVPGVY